jgi:hypothetical protein
MAKNSIKAEHVHGDKTSTVLISIEGDGLKLQYSMTSFETVPWDEIAELEVEGADAIQKRITASRLLTIGVFAFAFKKKTGEAFAFLSFKNNREALVFKFPKRSEPEVKAFFAPIRNRISNAPVAVSTNQDDSVAQLTKLGDLFEKGLIDEAEFKAGKAKILGLD